MLCYPPHNRTEVWAKYDCGQLTPAGVRFTAPLPYNNTIAARPPRPSIARRFRMPLSPISKCNRTILQLRSRRAKLFLLRQPQVEISQLDARLVYIVLESRSISIHTDQRKSQAIGLDGIRAAVAALGDFSEAPEGEPLARDLRSR